jgi:catechol 2,3-dioxygenase-like lactoylglutathione lyase family enzyme
MRYEVRFVYSGLRVRSLPRSVRFYERLGFRVIKQGGFSHGGRWVHLLFPGSDHRLELNWYPKGTPFHEPFRTGTEFDHFGFYTNDVRRWIRGAVRAGAKPVLGFVDGPAFLAFVKDPDGIWLGVCGPSWPGALPNLLPAPRNKATTRRRSTRSRRPVVPRRARS